MTAVISSLHLPTDSSNSTCFVRPNERPRRAVPFPFPKKLGSDRLLLVSKALHETPTFKSISPELQQQRKYLKRRQPPRRERRKHVHFRCVDQIHEFVKYDRDDHPHLFFSAEDFSRIHERDDVDFAMCFQEMQHTKQILQLWGMCSRGPIVNHSSVQVVAAAADKLLRDAPMDNARGLEQRIITGIRNHRQKAVQAFLQQYRETIGSSNSGIRCAASGTNTLLGELEDEEDDIPICPRYLKFSQTAGRFARALAVGDANVAQAIQEQEDE